MPMFNYHCLSCGVTCERLVTNLRIDEQKCHQCGHFLKRLVSAPAFSVKGFNAKNGYSSGGKNAKL